MSLPRRPRHTTHARPIYLSIFTRARHAIRRSPLWKTSSGIVAAALAIGMVAVGFALPASAHDNVVTGVVACSTTGSGWTVTWTVTNDWDQDATITSTSATVTPTAAGVVIKAAGNSNQPSTYNSAKFTQNVATAPGASGLTLTVNATWTDGTKRANSGTVSKSAFSTNCNPPAQNVCKDAGALVVTNAVKPNLSTATVTLKNGYTSCDVSLNSYKTQGPTWQTSGIQTFIDHDTVHLTSTNPTGTLTVDTQGCFQQQDLYLGTTRFDGTDGALPHYNDSATPTGLIDYWNGKVDANCVQPGLASASVTVTSATCTAPAELHWGAISNATFSGDKDGTVGPANYAVTATATSPNLFAAGTAHVSGDLKTQTFSGTLAGPIGYQTTNSNLPCYSIILGDPLVTPATCVNGVSTSGSIWVDFKPGEVTYKITGPNNLVIDPVTTATNTLPAGDYTVTATALPGFHLSGDTQWTLTIAAATGTCSTVTPPNTLPSKDISCAPVAGFLDGSFTLPNTPGISWFVGGKATAAGTYTVTTAQTVDVTAKPASSSWGFPAGATTSWSLVFTTPIDCQLTTHAQLLTAVTSTNEVCSPSGTATGGAITVAQVDDGTGITDMFGQGVSYFIDGVKVTSATTPKAAGTYHVTATADDPVNDVIVGASSWTITIASAAQACGQLTTLPFTGVSGNPIGILLIALLLLVAGTGVYTASRIRPRTQG